MSFRGNRERSSPRGVPPRVRESEHPSRDARGRYPDTWGHEWGGGRDDSRCHPVVVWRCRPPGSAVTVTLLVWSPPAWAGGETPCRRGRTEGPSQTKLGS